MWSFNVHWSSCKQPLFLSDCNETRIFLTDFRKKLRNTKFHKNPFSDSRAVLFGRTDRHDESNSLFSQLCEKYLSTDITVSKSHASFTYCTGCTFYRVSNHGALVRWMSEYSFLFLTGQRWSSGSYKSFTSLTFAS